MENIKQLEEQFKKRWHKYMMAIAVIHDIEGMIGLRIRDDKHE